MFSLLNEFSIYNQVSVAKSNRLKTTFRTKWGTFDFWHMHFGLINVEATFQKAKDIVFEGIIEQSMVVYMDDVIVFSRKRLNHLHHLKQIFERCRKYGISLNPNKSIFVVSEGNLIGKIITKSGITVDPNIVKAITQIPHPNDKKVMQSSLVKINFLRKFISNSTQIVKSLAKYDKERCGI